MLLDVVVGGRAKRILNEHAMKIRFLKSMSCLVLVFSCYRDCTGDIQAVVIFSSDVSLLSLQLHI